MKRIYSHKSIDVFKEASDSSEEMSKESEVDYEEIQELELLESKKLAKILGYAKKDQTFKIRNYPRHSDENRLNSAIDEALDLDGYIQLEKLQRITDRKIKRVEKKNHDKLNDIKELAMEKIGTYKKYEGMAKFKLPSITQTGKNLMQDKDVRRSASPSALSKMSRLIHTKFNGSVNGDSSLDNRDLDYWLKVETDNEVKGNNDSKNQAVDGTIRSSSQGKHQRLSTLERKSLSDKHQKADSLDKDMGLNTSLKKNDLKRLLFSNFNYLDSAIMYGKRGIQDLDSDKFSKRLPFIQNFDNNTKNIEKVGKIDYSEDN